MKPSIARSNAPRTRGRELSFTRFGSPIAQPIVANWCNLSTYYMRAPLFEPPFFQNREFGVVIKGEWHRYLQFDNLEKLRAYLIEKAPQHVYFSIAKYKYPDAEKANREWIGSDIAFDIDHDKLKNPTLQEAKKQSLKLIRILRRDFGLEDLLWVFSGSRGYHVHVRDLCIQQLMNPERREIADCFQEFLPGRKHKDGSPILNRKHVQIDAPVTCDYTRLMRLPGTIHGGSGLVCEVLPLPDTKLSI